MARRQSPVFILGSESYRVTALPATASRRIFTGLTKAAGPVIAKASEGDSSQSVAALLGEALQNVDDSFMDELCDTFAAVTQVDNIPKISDRASFDEHFSGRMGDQLKWIAECLKWEYSDFLSGLLASMNASEPDAGEDVAA